MSIVEVGNNATVENVRFAAVDASLSRVELAGSRAIARNISATSGNGTPPGIIVSGDDCTVDGAIVGQNSGDTSIEVTGDRARLIDVQSENTAFGTAVRFNGSTDSRLDGLISETDDHALVILDSTRITVRGVNGNSNDLEGVVLDGATDCDVEAVLSTVGQHGIRITDSSRNRLTGIIRDAGRDTTNTYDGIFVDGDSNQNRTSFTVSYSGAGNQMRYGINLSAATVDDHVEASILTGSGATANFNDAGTGTVLTDDHIV